MGDYEAGVLFVGEENYGVGDCRPIRGNRPKLVSVAAIEDGVLAADVEGLALHRSDEATYLAVSSQGDKSYAVYDTQSGAHLGSFRVGDHPEIDTDGIAATSVPLPGLPQTACWSFRTATTRARTRTSSWFRGRRSVTPWALLDGGARAGRTTRNTNSPLTLIVEVGKCVAPTWPTSVCHRPGRVKTSPQCISYRLLETY